MPPAVERRDVVVYRDPAAYSSHPCVARLPGGDYLVAFNETLPRRPHLHPPHDPRYVNVVARSRDGGVTWEAPRVAPGYERTGVECPSLTALPTGEVLLCQWQFRWAPLETARRLSRSGGPAFEVWDPALRRHWRLPVEDADWERSPVPYARGDSGCFVSVSTDGGATWDATGRVDTRPYPRGYTPRPMAILPDGGLLLALGSAENDETAVYVLRSADRGRTWGPAVTAIPRTPGRRFGEPSALALPDGRLVMLVREDHSRHLWSTESADGGRTWAPPHQTAIWGLPPHLTLLPDGRVLCVYGYRRPPFGLRACLSEDGGRTWDVAGEIVIRDDLPNGNCGYPTAVPDGDGRIFVAYYAEDDQGVTCVMGAHVRL